MISSPKTVWFCPTVERGEYGQENDQEEEEKEVEQNEAEEIDGLGYESGVLVSKGVGPEDGITNASKNPVKVTKLTMPAVVLGTPQQILSEEESEALASSIVDPSGELALNLKKN